MASSSWSNRFAMTERHASGSLSCTGAAIHDDKSSPVLPPCEQTARHVCRRCELLWHIATASLFDPWTPTRLPLCPARVHSSSTLARCNTSPRPLFCLRSTSNSRLLTFLFATSAFDIEPECPRVLVGRLARLHPGWGGFHLHSCPLLSLLHALFAQLVAQCLMSNDRFSLSKAFTWSGAESLRAFTTATSRCC